MRNLCTLTLVAFTFFCAVTVSAAADKEASGAAKTNELTAAEIGDGWIKLFDGETLFGWKASSNANWTVADGVITADKGDMGLLDTTTEFTDYELRCDYRLEKGGNSGIFLRTVFDPKTPAECYELNMCDSHATFPTGSIVTHQKPVRTLDGEGKWHTYHVKVQGNTIDVKFDGEPVLSFTDKESNPRKSGYIGLQKNVGKAEYRNVYLRPLSTKPLFNGKDLTGWRVVPGGKSEFKVVDGNIHVQNGRGFLETEEKWGNFILQAEAKTNGKKLNSGIFFRAIAGTEKNPSDGYECQIHNGWKDDDRTKPLDYGTGAIYRRIAARKVVSNDFEWLTLTLAAEGPHVAVWVNGYQVTDWTDTRKPNDNPRNGLRTAPGHFSLQGHDPTTDLNFRNIRVEEIPDSK